jgi:hypothetical protein
MTVETIITEKEFQDFAQERLAAAIINPALFFERFMEVLDFAAANEARMDAGAKPQLSFWKTTLSIRSRRPARMFPA